LSRGVILVGKVSTLSLHFFPSSLQLQFVIAVGLRVSAVIRETKLRVLFFEEKERDVLSFVTSDPVVVVVQIALQ